MKNAIAWLVVFLLGPLPLACTSMQSQREACYAQADIEFVVEAEKLCPDGGAAWDACPHRERLLNTLASKYAGCP